jgi:alkylhydroperoxidase family enzyme
VTTVTHEEAGMARISLDPPRTFALRIGERFMRRSYGKVMAPVLALGHNPKVLRSLVGLESKVPKWNRLDESLKILAELAASARIGCSWCMDFGYWVSEQHGLSLEKVNLVPTWREHPESFTKLEQLAMEFAEAMTATPPTVTDELVASLSDRLGEPALVELTAQLAVANQRSRFNVALGLTSQGFSDQCAIPPRIVRSER